MQWYLGTMGYGYKDWEGVFYPPSLQSRDYLAHYSQYFNAVEIDTSFYGTPRPEVVRRWATITPEAFTFCPKVPRQITHESRLRGAAADMSQFLSTMRLLGDKLGPILIQLSPDFTRAEIDALADFLDGLPRDLRFAVEFRDRSWHAIATGELLQSHNAAWVSTAYLYLPQRVYVTTDFVYIRWIGGHGTYQHHDHERVDRVDHLRNWLSDIETRQDADDFDAVYGFFNNDYAGFAPGTCQRFKQLVGLPTQPLAPPEQGRLF